MRVKKALLLSAAILALAIGSTTTHFARRKAKAEEPTPAATTTPATPQSASLEEAPLSQSDQARSDSEASSDIKVVLLALRPEGFEPETLELPAGEYLFVIRNRSGLDEINLRLTRGDTEHFREGRVPGRRRDWKQRVQLSAGTYRVTETGHQNWTCRIVVGR
jgi:hypothetical protein